MDYEKKYKAALNWMKDVYPTLGGAAKEDANHYFPELIESEDERIRKSLLEYLHTLPNHYAHSGVCTPEWIAWLEKQGKQEPFDYENANIQQTDFAPKVKPKFHEGEWLCENGPNNYARFIQILEIVNVHGVDRYRISRDIHRDEAVDELDFIEKCYHKFDIEDARDGDVLHSPSHRLIWIYKDNEHYHACVNMNYVTENVATDGLISIPNDACPATRVQRSILFQKMEESNCKWDAEKKELKKIEQKPNETEKWRPQEESCICQLESLVKKQWRQAEKVHNSVNIKKMSELMFFLKTLNPNKKPQRIISAEAKEAMYDKPAWSEVDENMLNLTLGLLSYHRQCRNWLKSLKDRVQPKQEWSALDERNLQGIIDEIEANKNDAPDYDLATYDRFLSWLKSLRPQNRWKPSDEQIEALESATENCAYSEYQDCLRELIGQLKKLREE